MFIDKRVSVGLYFELFKYGYLYNKDTSEATTKQLIDKKNSFN